MKNLLLEAVQEFLPLVPLPPSMVRRSSDPEYCHALERLKNAAEINAKQWNELYLALSAAAKKFSDYENLHLAKGNREKAKANGDMALMLDNKISEIFGKRVLMLVIDDPFEPSSHIPKQIESARAWMKSVIRNDSDDNRTDENTST